MIAILKNIADVQAGHPFRGSVPQVEGGNAFALQMRDVSAEGGVTWDSLVQTDINERKQPQWLQNGDIVFVARGVRNYAVCLKDIPKPSVCSQNFFLVRVTSPALLPQFLAWQINRLPAQRYLASNAEGTDQLSIRRGVLEDLPISIPSLERQKMIVTLADSVTQEKKYLEALIRNRIQLLDAIAFELTSQKLTTDKK